MTDGRGQLTGERRAAMTGRSWRRTLRGYLLLPHLLPVLVVEAATASFAVIAWGGLPPISLLAPLLISMLGGQLAIGATNELVDLPRDAHGKPWKPLPSGDVSVPGAKIVVGVGLALMTAFGLLLGIPAFALLALGTGLGFAYDLWLKQTAWSWLPYLLALPLLPIWVFVALGRFETDLLLLHPLGALATAGVHFAQAAPDVAVDRAAGLRTVTSRLGTELTLLVAWLFTLSAPALAWAAAGRVFAAGSLTPITVAGVLTGVACMVNVGVLIVDRSRGAVVCFALVALSTLATGLAWTMVVAHY
jgi:4-hydroxybenzoate polyprenyltransferase